MSAGVRLGPHLRELRVHLCQRSGASEGVREWIKTHYVPLKRENPKFPILIRECSGIMPKIWARYDHGNEVSVPLEDKKTEEVMGIVKELAAVK